MNWREAVWQAVQREALRTDGIVTRQNLIDHQLHAVMAATGAGGRTPEQTMSRLLQELRDEGVILFDGNGIYRLSAASGRKRSLDEALVTEREALRTARVGQGKFRMGLLDRFQRCCPMTGIADPDMLLASHIIPWAHCRSDAERLDVENGLLLSALWDAAFDSRRVSFSPQGAALVAKDADQALIVQLRGAPCLLLHDAVLTHPVQARLAEHRKAAGEAALILLHA